ncbi:MAG: bacillithiol biosynthesis cysteine-adding enzyme BshC [Flavobacterium sp.]|nr:bacillithiol biosynthesis cysteine-adding enzyme BshC [Flavobacterium sp.]
MPNDCITFQNSGYFSKLIVDYLNQDEKTQKLYNRFPSIENFSDQITEKSIEFNASKRQILVSQLTKQYEGFSVDELTLNNIKILKEDTTFTVTTGHQLNLFTGPIYFIYKIVATINLANELKVKYPKYNFVPIYWMATEDHDFEEINHFYYNGTKISWDKKSTGPVGRLSTDGIDSVYNTFSNLLNGGENANYLRDLFRKAYLEHKNLTDATRYLVNELFQNTGLVIIDGDVKELKKEMIPFFKDELLHNTSYKSVENILNNLKENYSVQVNPREINLFYITDTLRERIIFEDNHYKINNTLLSFTESEILVELQNYPERFSPNVILRPLYQEVILPNLCYIGGGGEIAYWLQLKEMFQNFNVAFPILKLRNSAVIATQKQQDKIKKLHLNWNDLFKNQRDLINEKTKAFSNFEIDFTKQKEFLKNQFSELEKIAAKTDKSFIGAVKAQEKKQIKGLENLEKRLLKAEKRNHQLKLSRIIQIQDELFPNGSLQERKINASDIMTDINVRSFLFLLKKSFEFSSNQFNVIIL